MASLRRNKWNWSQLLRNVAIEWFKIGDIQLTIFVCLIWILCANFRSLQMWNHLLNENYSRYIRSGKFRLSPSMYRSTNGGFESLFWHLIKWNRTMPIGFVQWHTKEIEQQLKLESLHHFERDKDLNWNDFMELHHGMNGKNQVIEKGNESFISSIFIFGNTPKCSNDGYKTLW